MPLDRFDRFAFCDHICLAPVVRRRSCKQPIANRFPRNFTSAWISPGRPLWLRRLTAHGTASTLDFWLDGVLSFRSRSWRISCGAAALSALRRSRPLIPCGDSRRKVFADGSFNFQRTTEAYRKPLTFHGKK